MTAVAITAACKLAEKQQYTQCAPLCGGLIFFGNRFVVKAFLPVLDGDGQG
jgi:hypothetical protein